MTLSTPLGFWNSLAWDRKVNHALLRVLSCMGLVEAVLLALIKASGAMLVSIGSTMSTEQRAHVKVPSRAHVTDEQERWRDKEACMV